jgi:hypothetical protein
MVEWLGTWGDRLVLLDEFPLLDVQAAVATAQERIRAHGLDWVRESLREYSKLRASELAEVLRSDHRHFEMSVLGLRELLGVVEHEDHGGHRQALGQYSRLLAAAFVRHRRDEQEWERQTSHSEPTPPRNPN